jgi:hypothetical protein
MRKRLVTLGLVVALVACGSGTAAAASEILWSNSFQTVPDSQSANSLAFASVDGLLGGRFAPFAGVPVVGPRGVAIDPVRGRIYWANGVTPTSGQPQVAWSSLDGGSGGIVELRNGATFDDPIALAIDPVGRRLYWSNFDSNTLAWAGLDTADGGQVTVPPGAFVQEPFGVTVDPVGRRLYWSNFSDGEHPISYADLDDPDGGSVAVPPGAIGQPHALAFDQVSRRLYWSNPTSIGFVNVDQPTDRGTLTAPPGATIFFPWGLAIDPMDRRLYWANVDSLSFMDLDAATPTGGTLAIPASAPVQVPAYLLMLLAPHPVAPPAISGGAQTGATLSCSQGGWAGESLATFPYRAPQAFQFAWSRDGVDLAHGASTLTADAPGDYRCTVTGFNTLGLSTRQTSAVQTVVAAPPGGGTGSGTGTGTGGGTGTGTGGGTGSGTGSGTGAGTNTGTGTGGTGAGGGTDTGSGPGGVPDRTPPVLSRVRLSPARFRVGKARTAVAARRVVVRGTLLRFVSSEAGRLSIAIERAKPGRKVKRHGRSSCRAVRKAVRRGRCTVSVRVATLTRAIKPGSGSVAFSGRVGAKALAPGVYALTLTARDAAGNASKPVRLAFTILKG